MIVMKGKKPRACFENWDERRMFPCHFLSSCEEEMKMPSEPEIKHPNCPIVAEIPDKHGRLIDADVLKRKMIDYGWKHPDSTVTEFVDDIPTILEATE